MLEVQDTRIDAPSAIEFKETAHREAQGNDADVVLDLTQVTFIDSSGLGAVVALMKLLAPGRELRLAGLAPAVEKVFALTRMDSVFKIFPTPQDAIDAHGP